MIESTHRHPLNKVRIAPSPDINLGQSISRRRLIRIAGRSALSIAALAALAACGNTAQGRAAGPANPSPTATGAAAGMGTTPPMAGMAMGSPAGSPAAPEAAPGPNQDFIDNFSFRPNSLTVPVGTEVTWINHDDVPHTVTSRQQGLFGSPALDTDNRFAFRFTSPGDYAYYCAIHPFMTAQVVVQG